MEVVHISQAFHIDLERREGKAVRVDSIQRKRTYLGPKRLKVKVQNVDMGENLLEDRVCSEGLQVLIQNHDGARLQSDI